ncbi:hypothetical protein SPRG_13949 [Saprolegnia parasitica CBS 223.65]|uniref:Dienelactone hydrolase domain-containing protein n=1 Tax=Saprolegnia parasitica (strain CBS 223.65) TaxID=695850 RepID=A0A067C378_SAPPC|nr:hypothetical protein SPRG_13949 [Saprolegnia parasitica CBS 223.65]KDO21021.1 hypothetical protein SPRG_13949 [Saprolegnia parasitica CBS 223.65]|eukprot:XP_012208273.1 hypothetical protein SPRG_13949 [Saprolegnia parasitica CBS 223.65]
MQHPVVGAGSEIEWSSPDGPQRGYLVFPEAHVGRIMTGVVIAADAPGFASHHVRTFADKLAEQGYKVLVPEAPYAPLSAVDEVSRTPQFVQWQREAAAKQDDVLARLRAARDVLKNFHEVTRVGVLGLGVGSEAALALASESPASFDAAVVLCPTTLAPVPLSTPTLLVTGDRYEYIDMKQIREYVAVANVDSHLRVKALAGGQRHGFCFSHIMDEDAGTLAIAEVLDWLIFYLHRFRLAAGTSDGDPWWPQGRNGPFYNVGLANWQANRAQWTTPVRPRPPRRPPVDSSLILEGLASMRRTFELPQPMNLSDVIALYVDIWDVNQ